MKWEGKAEETVWVQIRDLQGRLLHHAMGEQGREIQLDVSESGSGIYLLEAQQIGNMGSEIPKRLVG